MKQVWIDYKFWQLFSVWAGTIAGHVRSAIRVYLACRNHLGIYDEVDGKTAESMIFAAFGMEGVGGEDGT